MSAPTRRYAPRLPGDERREQALDAALGLIVEHGHAGVSMEAVARACGVTKPVIYEHFANRGELLRALLEREERRALAELARLMPEAPDDADPDAVLVDGIHAFLEAVHANRDAWGLILMPAQGTPDVVRAHIERGRRSVVARVAELVGWGLERRGGPAALEIELTAEAIVALGEHAARLTLTDPARYPPHRLRAFARELLRAVPPDRPRAPGTGHEWPQHP